MSDVYGYDGHPARRIAGRSYHMSVPGGAILRQNGNTGVFLYNPSDKTIRRCDVTVTRLLSEGRCLITSDEVQPVSYTHLDVYKRQAANTGGDSIYVFEYRTVLDT